VLIKRNREEGKVFRKQASSLVFGKEFTLQTRGHDKYRRTLGDGILADGSNVNQMLVKDGWCWWYRKYAPGDTMLEGLETEARKAQKGLWVDSQPILPWERRNRRHRPDRYLLRRVYTGGAASPAVLQCAR